MAKNEWTVKLEDGEHKVEAEYSYWSKKRKITVDGKLIEQKRNLFDTDSEHCFTINKHPCTVLITSHISMFTSNLIVDGISIETGKQVDIPLTSDEAGISKDLEKAKSRINAGWGAGLASVVLGLLFGIIAVIVVGMSLWGYIIDILVILALSYGVYRKSRVCAVLLFIYFITGKTLVFIQIPSAAGVIVGLFIAFFLFQGIWGTFAYHRIIKAAGQKEKAETSG